MDKKSRHRIIVIGSGAGGAMVAKELAKDCDVTVLEAGGSFHPLPLSLELLSKFRATGLFLDERMISLLLPNMHIAKVSEQVIVYGSGVGGTTTLATGNAVRADEGLKRIGIQLDEEFKELFQELPITTDHQRYWSKVTRDTFEVMQELGMNPQPMPKFLRTEQCRLCGHCSIGCPHGAKWDTRELLNGIRVITGCKVVSLQLADNKVKRIIAKQGLRTVTYEADTVIVAAGGLGTPQILAQSGIPCEPHLFVDPVLCVAAPMNKVRQNRQLLMPFVSERKGYIISPYMDWLSFFFNRNWRKPMDSMVSLMIKMADTEQGTVNHGKVNKVLTGKDKELLQQGVEDCREILLKMGIHQEDIILGTLNSGHPGGMLPLSANDAETLHNPSLPDNLYVADASLLPESLGLPPMLTIMALSKRIAKIILRS